MSKSFEVRVNEFKKCLLLTKNEDGNIDIRAAILIAHRRFGLNAADNQGGIGSDQAAFDKALHSAAPKSR